MSERAYSNKQFAVAVSLAALLGWATVAVPIIAQYVMRPDRLFSVAVSIAAMTAIFGIPIALIACWAVAGPILWRVMQRPVTWRRAAFWGLVIPLVMASLGVAIARLNGLWAYYNPNFSFQNGGGEYVQEVDGILTPYGWWLTGRDSLIFVLCGFAIALVVRAVIGAGHKQDSVTLE
jgi:hypothetical protein